MDLYQKTQGSLLAIQNGPSPPFRDVSECTAVHLRHHAPYMSFILRMLSYKIELTRIPEIVRHKLGALLQIVLASVLDAAPSLLRPLLINHARKRWNYILFTL